MTTSGMHILTNGRLVLPGEVLEGYDIVVSGNAIDGLQRAGTTSGAGHRVTDVSGRYIMPGMIDIHSDYIEHVAAPRPSAIIDFSLALAEAERTLITHGITTIYHSVTVRQSLLFRQNRIRSPETTRALIDAINQASSRPRVIRHRVHGRLEVDAVDRMEEILDYIRMRRVRLISFTDHSPGQGQYRDLEVFRRTLKRYRNLNDAEIDDVTSRALTKEKLPLERLLEIAANAHRHGVAVASHDDDSIEKLDLMESLGVTISEFPITLDVARRARARSMHTVAGAPNVLLGGSHSGNLSAAEAVLDGAVDVLCSDYYPAAMLHAVFALASNERVHLPDVVRLVSMNPARALGTETSTGSIESGKRADLLAVAAGSDGQPAVTAAWIDGVPVYESTYRR